MTTLDFPKVNFALKLAEKPVVDSENRLITFNASDETPVLRFDWYKWEPFELVFDHSPEAVDLSRVKAGSVMFLADHSDYTINSRLGKVKDAKVIDGRLQLKVKINKSDSGLQFLEDVEDETEPPTSIGAYPTQLKVEREAKYEIDKQGRKKMTQMALLRATNWQLMEFSAVNIPAIPTSGVSRNSHDESQLITCSIEGNFNPLVALQDDEANEVTSRGNQTLQDKTEMETNEQISKLQKDLEAEKTRNEELKGVVNSLTEQVSQLNSMIAGQQLASEYDQLRNQAEKYRDDGRLALAQFDKWFGNRKDDLARYTGDKGAIRLEVISDFISSLENVQPALKTTKTKKSAKTVKLEVEDEDIDEFDEEYSDEELAFIDKHYTSAWKVG